MRVFFLNPEQYVRWEQEPSNYELRLPVLHCGVVTDHQDFGYQRLVRQEGHREMNRRLLAEVADWGPDLVIHSTTWPEYLVDPATCRRIMAMGIPIYTHLWDTFPRPYPHELDIALNTSYLGVTGTIANYLFYKSLAGRQRHLRQVTFTAGHNVFTDLMQRKELEKTRNVCLLGSNEGHRKQLVGFLEAQLERRGIGFDKVGGMLDSAKIKWSKGLRLSDQWVSWEEYVEVINQSRICLCSQSDIHRTQIKGKLFDYMACGAFVLTDDNPEVRKYFPDDCLAYYEDRQDCLEKVLYYLEHEEEREAIAARGHRWFQCTFDYKRFWSAVLTTAVTGQGRLPDLPGEAGRHEPRWLAQCTSLAAEGAARPDRRDYGSLYPPPPAPKAGQAPWQPGRRVHCSLPWYKLEIAPDGSFGPCCHYRQGRAATPASARELAALWNAGEMRDIRQRLLEGRLAGTPCADCYDRFFTTDHDIFGMGGHIPRYTRPGGPQEGKWREADRLYREGRTLLPNLPLELNLLTSERCNLNCIMCSQNRNHRPAQVPRILALVEDLGWESLDRFGYVGGETFLTEDALQLLDHIAGSDTRGACIYITSNGTLLHRHLDRLERLDNLFLTLSVDGVGEGYERIRRGAKWARLLETLETLRGCLARHPDWRINFNSIIMKSTYRCLTDLIDLALSVPATLFFMPINGGHPREDIFHNPDLLADPDEFAAKLSAAAAYAGEKGADKARDSLEKALVWWHSAREARSFATTLAGPGQRERRGGWIPIPGLPERVQRQKQEV